MRSRILLSASVLLLIASCGGGNEENQTSDTQVENVPETSPPETSPPESEASAESTPVEVDLPFLSIERDGGTEDCYNEEGGIAVIAMNCDDLHLGQIISTYLYGPVDPEEGDFGVGALARCSEYFKSFKYWNGDDTENSDSRWISRVLIDRLVSGRVFIHCTVEDANGDLWAGTFEEAIRPYFGIEVGDCFDFPTATSKALEIDCNDPHEGEMYIVDEFLADEEPFPPYRTEDEWDEIATFVCEGTFMDYTGYSASDENDDLTYSYVFVNLKTIDLPMRLLSCAVVSYDGTLLEGSTRK